MDNNPSDQSGGTGGGVPADTNVPTGGSTYTPPAAPVEPVVPPAPEVGGDTGSGEQPGGQPTPLGDQPTPGAPVV